jgi:hypothetical protein
MIVLLPLLGGAGAAAGANAIEVLGAFLWCGWAATPYLAIGLLAWVSRKAPVRAAAILLATAGLAAWGSFVYFRDYVYPTAQPGFSWAIIIVPFWQWLVVAALGVAVALPSLFRTAPKQGR